MAKGRALRWSEPAVTLPRRSVGSFPSLGRAFERLTPFAVPFLLAACDDDGVTDPDPDPIVAAVEVTPSEVSLEALEATTTLSAAAVDTDGNEVPTDPEDFEWSSSDEGVATVGGPGEVTAVGVGEATVTATLEGRTGQAAVTVAQVAATLTISLDELFFDGEGETAQLDVEVADALDNPIPEPEVDWSSSDEEVATVDAEGLVTAVGEGEAEIRARVDEAEASVPARVIVEKVFEGDLTVFDEEDLADFEANGWTVVDGNLTIGGEESPLADLEGMESLRRVTGGLVVRDNPALEDVSALSGLEEVGDFKIVDNGALHTLPSFSALASVEFEVVVFGNPDLEAIGGFPELTHGGVQIRNNAALSAIPEFPSLVEARWSLWIAGNPLLETVGGFPVLEEMSGMFWFSDNDALAEIPEFPALVSGMTNFRIQDNPSLEAIGGFPALAETTGPFELVGNPALTAVPEFPELRSTGPFRIHGNAALGVVEGFPALETVQQFLVANNPELPAIPPFPALVSVAGLGTESRLEIRENAALEVVGGFPALETVGGRLEFRANSVLDEVPGFPELGTVWFLRIEGNEALGSVGDFPALESMGSMAVVENPALGAIGEFGSLITVDGLVRIWDNPSLEVSGTFPVLETVGTVLDVRRNDALSSLPGFPSLTSVGALSVANNPALSDLEALSMLTAMEGGLFLTGNQALENLDGLSGVTSTVQDITISANEALTDITGLENIGSAEGADPAVQGDFSVTDNPNLPQSQAEDLADALGVGGTVTISGNQDDS